MFDFLDFSWVNLEWLNFGIDNLAEWNLGTVDVRFLFYIGIFVGALVAANAILEFLAASEKQDEASNRRMKMIREGATTEEILLLLKPDVRKTGFEFIPVLGNLPAVLRQGGIRVSAGRFLFYCTVAFILVYLAAMPIVGLLAAIPVALLVGFVIPLIGAYTARSKRINRFVSQLPDALELMARGLRVGHPLSTTLQSVAEEMPDPIATEFGVVVDQVAYGDELPEAIRELSERIDQEDMHYLSVSIGIQHGTGGDLAGILDTLAKTIRARIQMRAKIRAISSESRSSAILLSCIPVIIFFMMSVLTPSYFGAVSKDPLYIPMLVTIAIFTVLNALILRKLVNFRF